jgi:hypothetical protein
MGFCPDFARIRLWVMGFHSFMGYGVKIPAYQVGGPKKPWGIRGYGLYPLWVKRGSTVYGAQSLLHSLMGCATDTRSKVVHPLTVSFNFGQGSMRTASQRHLIVRQRPMPLPHVFDTVNPYKFAMCSTRRWISLAEPPKPREWRRQSVFVATEKGSL